MKEPAMTELSNARQKADLTDALPLPDEIATPCFVILEKVILANLQATAKTCGGIHRLMPHVKTHRAEWIVKLLAKEGVSAFKVATVMEANMVLSAGVKQLLWAYPTVNRANIRAFLESARANSAASLGALVDSPEGLSAWCELMGDSHPENLKLLVDLDPGMGRTGVPLDTGALELARKLTRLGCFGGWHIYDGHIQDKEVTARRERIEPVMQKVRDLMRAAAAEALSTNLVAGASYSFDVWPDDLATYVAPGSWVFSSSQHDAELPHLGWKPAGYVLATVISKRGSTATLDAGSKAISPDKPITERFRWNRKILMINEEHAVVEDDNLTVGDKVLLMPKHACTTAYLYDRALVHTIDGRWEYRPQLGSKR
jgi:3-hydroxy-D-aspartate aldolase